VKQQFACIDLLYFLLPNGLYQQANLFANIIVHQKPPPLDEAYCRGRRHNVLLSN